MEKTTSKNILVLLLCSTLLVSTFLFTGCNNKNDNITIGITQIVDHPSLDNCRNGAIDKLAELGYIEGENLEINYQSAQGDPSVASTIAQDFIADKVDLILAISTPSAQAAYGAAFSKDIPVVFSAVTDPVAAELAETVDTPFENITGTSDVMPMEAAMKLINDILPDAKKVGILHNTSEVNSDIQLKSAQSISKEFNLEIVDKGITSTNEIASALDTLLVEVDCLLNLTDNMVVSAMPLISEKCIEAGKPIIGSEEEQVKNGALAAEGIDYYNLGMQTGAMIAKILEGSAAEEIPVESMKESKLTINKAVADKLEITIPDNLMERAEILEGE